MPIVEVQPAVRVAGNRPAVTEGRAALLVTGGRAGPQSPDLPGAYGSKVAVVGRDGSYRMLRYGHMYRQAAQDMLLSPDGRYVAGDATLEDLFTLRLYDKDVTVVDLVTGDVRRYRDLPARQPVGWSPDGAHLLLWQPNSAVDGRFRGGALWLLDLATGDTRQLVDLHDAEVHRATFVAFAPDGQRLAVQMDQRLVVVDTVDGGSRDLADLGPRGVHRHDGDPHAARRLDGTAPSPPTSLTGAAATNPPVRRPRAGRSSE